MKSLFTVLAFLAASSAGASTLSTITFDALDGSSDQTVPLTSFSEAGYTFDVSFTSSGGIGAAIFDTTCTGQACNGDTDLRPNDRSLADGNILIIQEKNASVPDDAATKGQIVLTLADGPAFRWVGAAAVDEQPITFSTLADGQLGVIDNAGNGDVDQVLFQSSVINKNDSLIIDFAGSGGVDNLQLAAVPVPAALPLLLGALGGMGWVARRRRAAD